jgi:hypothetical protein
MFSTTAIALCTRTFGSKGSNGVRLQVEDHSKTRVSYMRMSLKGVHMLVRPLTDSSSVCPMLDFPPVAQRLLSLAPLCAESERREQLGLVRQYGVFDCEVALTVNLIVPDVK